MYMVKMIGIKRKAAIVDPAQNQDATESITFWAPMILILSLSGWIGVALLVNWVRSL